MLLLDNKTLMQYLMDNIAELDLILIIFLEFSEKECR